MPVNTCPAIPTEAMQPGESKKSAGNARWQRKRRLRLSITHNSAGGTSGIVMEMKTSFSKPEPRALVDAANADSLIQGELEAGAFPDERLGKRLGMMLDQFADGTAESVPLACQDWANTKAAYRFFANDRVTEADILAGHFRSTRERFSAVDGTILVLHDTTQLSYRREVEPGSAGPGASVGQPPVVWALAAFQPGAHAGRSAVGAGGGEVLDAPGFPRARMR